MIAFCFTCSERKMCSTTKESQNIMNMVVGNITILMEYNVFKDDSTLLCFSKS